MAIQIILILIAFLALVISLLLAVSNVISMALGAPAVSSPRHELIKKFADKEKTLLDLGCGLGNVCIQSAPYFKHVYGIEYSPWYYLLSRLRTNHLKNVTILHGNFFTTAWPKTDYIYCYLMPELLTQLVPLFKKQRSTVLSLGFQIQDVTPKKIIREGQRTLYIYGL